MNRAKVITMLSALFLAGVMAGGFVGYNLGRRTAEPVIVPEQPKPPGPNSFSRPPGPRKNTLDRLTTELALTGEQLVSIGPIITEFDEQLEKMSKQSWNDLWLAISNRNERIKPFLTPDQLKLLDERNSKRRMMPGGGPPRRDHEHREKQD